MSDRRIASGWKEIGSVLGVTDRHAQRFAARDALPIHGRGRKWAYVDELIAWAHERDRPAPALRLAV